MNKILKNKKIIFGAIVISLLVYFVFSDFASAQEGFTPGRLPTSAEQLTRGATSATLKGAAGAVGITALGKAADLAVWGLLLLFIFNVTLWLLNFLFTAASAALNAGLTIALDPGWINSGSVLEAWQLVRDFANIAIILVLLVIALITILRVSNYQAKRLLPAIIGIALVINFSLPLSKFVIDAANIIAFQFVKQIRNENGDVAINIANGLGIQQIIAQADVKIVKKGGESIIPPPSEEQSLIPKANAQVSQTICAGLGVATGGAAFFVCQGAALVIGTLGLIYGPGWVESALSSLTGSSAIGHIPTLGELVVSNILLAAAVFVTASIAILVLLRTIALMLVVVLSPVGLLSAVLPSTQEYWKKWSNYLLNQSFFLPILLFLLWFALKFMSYTQASLDAFGENVGFNRLGEDPTSPRLIFFVMSWMLLFAILPLARSMGAIGAGTLIKAFDWTKSAITGFVGGLAARTFVAPLGATMTAAGLPEALGKAMPWWLGGPLTGVKARDFSEWLAKRGKAPEKAAEKAELGMHLAPADRAAYFAKLDRAAKEAMLRKMKAEERESMFAGLSTAETEAARQILRSAAFAPEDRASAEVEEFQRKWQGPNQWKNFGSLSEDARHNFLLRFTDNDRRAEFLQKVKEGGDSMVAQNANDFMEKNARFTANQQFDYAKARWKQELTAAQKADRIPEFMSELMKGATTDEEIERASALQKNYFKFGMDDRQRLDLLEESYENKEEMAKFGEWVLDLKPEDQNKFYRETLGKLASPEAVVAFINAVSTGDPAKDLPTQKRILSAASPQQLGRVASESTPLRPLADQIAADTMSIQNQNLYEKNKDNPPPSRGGGGKGMPWSGGGPTLVAPTATTTTALDAEINRINLLDRNEDADAIRFAIDELSKKPEFEKLRRKINILTDFKFIEKGKTPRELMEFLQKTIPGLSATEIHDKIDAETLAISQVWYHVLEKANIEQLGRLVLDPERAKIIKELIHDLSNFYESDVGTSMVERIARERNTTSYGARNIILKDPELYSEALANIFEQEFKNRELAKTLSRISKTPKENLTNPGELRIKERLFE